MNALSALPLIFLRPTESTARRPERFVEFEPGYRFWHNGYEFMLDYRADYRRLFALSRAVTVVLALGLGLLLFAWARVLVDRRHDLAGLLAAGLVWFSPNFLAHARLVTTDVGAACFLTLALWGWWRWLAVRDRRSVVVAGVALGLAQLVKFTAVFLVPVLLVWTGFVTFLRPREERRTLALQCAGGLALALVSLHAGYLFKGSFTTLGRHNFESRGGRFVAETLPGWLPLPVPAPYAKAFDLQLVEEEIGAASFLLGESYRGGRWDYFLVLFAFKMPFPLMGLFLLALVSWRAPPVDPRAGARLVLLAPMAVLLIVYSTLAAKQLGVRMLLPAAPPVLLWVATTLAAAHWRRYTPALLTGLVVWLGVETLRSFPDYLAYFNPFAGGRDGGHRIAVASNVDWGQDLPALATWLDDQGVGRVQLFYFGRVAPEIYGIPYFVDLERFRPGYLAISTTLYARWYRLWDHGRVVRTDPVDRGSLGRPVASIGGSIHVFRIPGSPVSATGSGDSR